MLNSCWTSAVVSTRSVPAETASTAAVDRSGANSWTKAAFRIVLPSFPAGAELLIVALVGTNFSINAAFFTSYATKARGIRRDEYADATLSDTIPGIVAPGIMTALVIMVAAAVLGHTGQRVETLPQLASVFEPLAGQIGYYVFVTGFFAAAFLDPAVSFLNLSRRFFATLFLGQRRGQQWRRTCGTLAQRSVSPLTWA